MQTHYRFFEKLYAYVSLCCATIFLMQCADPMEAIEAETLASVHPNNENANVTLLAPTLSNGSLYEISVPDGWDQQNLVLFAHGWVSTLCPPHIPDLSINGTSVEDIIINTGAAVARIGYYKTGLPEADKVIEDLVELVEVFETTTGVAPANVILSGVSLGGLITVLALEQHPEIFDGGLAACGPYGDFQKEVNYLGDFFVLFKYYFDDILDGLGIDIGNPTGIPLTTQNGWEQCVTDPGTGEVIVENQPGPVQLALLNAITSNPAHLKLFEKVLKVAEVPLPSNPTTAELLEAAQGIFRLNILGTNDINNLLGGIPFGNSDRIYGLKALGKGIINFREFRALNKLSGGVQRISATATVDPFITSGKLDNPVVTLHTTLDPTQPFWHALIYRAKTLSKGSGLKNSIVAVDEFGHCDFTVEEVLKAFERLQILMALDEIL